LTVTLLNEAAEGPRYAAYHWAVILATPFVLLAINPNLFINPTGDVVDPWVYTGFFLSLPDHLIVWGRSYYSTRISWLLPGYALHQIFSPLVANYVLHFGFFYILLSAVYRLITAGVNRTTAFIATLLVGWNPQVIAAMSWDYVDGAVITYFAVTLLFLEKAASSEKRWALWAVASGAALACLVTANLVAATLVPVCVLFLVLRVSLSRWKAAGVILIIAGLGSLAMLGILAHTNWQLGGRFLFLLPSVSFASARLWVPSPYDVQGLSWLTDAHFLILQAAASLGGLLALSRRPQNVASFAGSIQLIFLVASAWWVIHSVLWTHSIHVSYYTDYIVPLGLIALVLIPNSPLARSAPLRLRDALTLELTTLAVLIAAHVLLFRWGHLSWPFNSIAAFAVCAVALILFRFTGPRWLRWPAYFLTLWIAYGAVPGNWAKADAPRVKENFETTVAAHRYLWERLDNNRRLAMWYSLTPGESRPFRSIASTYLWVWMLVNENLPALNGSEAASLTPNGQLVLLVPDPGESEVVKQALRKFDFDYTPREQKRFGPDTASFWVVVGDLSRIHKGDQ
jgi:hypothetical protein